VDETPLSDAPALPAEPTQESIPTTWEDLGFAPNTTNDGTLRGIVPDGVLILAATSPEANEVLGVVCQAITTGPPFAFKFEGAGHFAYRLADNAVMPQHLSLSDGVMSLGAGAKLTLPDQVPDHTELPVLTDRELATLAAPSPEPAIVNSPLQQYSLRGKGEEFERQAVKAKPLLGNLCLAGQATVWYAPPNSGKTVIALKLLDEAIADGRITPDNVYYINADDGSEGFATKLQLMDDLGVHTLAPGHQGFEARMLPELFHEMANRNKAKGALVIVDTIKKVASVMDKGKASYFTQASRIAVMAGATIVGFAHTNKQPQANGKLQYGGTTDLRDDFDAAYLMGPIETDSFAGDRVVMFECIKSRGSNAQSVAYAYAAGEDVAYAERLASVRLVADKELNGFQRTEEAKADAEVVAAIEACIREADHAKMALGKAVAKRVGVSERAALRIIEKYTGTDPAVAKWHFQRKGHGKMVFALLRPAEETPEPPGVEPE
jgi:hypothetical protein